MSARLKNGLFPSSHSHIILPRIAPNVDKQLIIDSSVLFLLLFKSTKNLP